MGKPVGLELLYSPDGNDPALADIIFVHGLGGHRRDTWTKVLNKDELPQPMLPTEPQRKRDRLKSLLHTRQSSPIRASSQVQREIPEVENGDASKKVFWPLALLPDTLPGCRIYTWGYDVDILGPSTTTVFQHARNLLSNVADDRMSSVDRQRPIVWVAHSLGGIVVKDALNQSRTASTYLKAILPATYGVCFLGTPHRGSSLAAFGATIARITCLWGASPSLQVINALKYDAETLSRIQTHFKETLELRKTQSSRIAIRSFCESYKTSGVLVVDHFSSGIDDVDDVVTNVAANHSQLSKFASSADAGYIDVSNALKRWVIEISENSSKYHEIFEDLRTDYMRSLENHGRGIRVRQVEKTHGHTFAWLFSDTVPFQDWLQQREPIFWIHGKPGAAKSTLMKYALLHPKTKKLLHKSHQGLWTLIPFFFSDRGSSIQKTVDGLLQELLYQLLSHYEDLMSLVVSTSLRSILPEISITSYTIDNQEPGRLSWDIQSIQNAHKIIKDDIKPGGARRLCAPEVLMEALMAIVQQNKIPINVLFFIDALDEHQGSHIELIKILRCLSSAENSATVRIKLCLASRQESVFPGAFHKSPGFAIHEYTHSDIKQYVVDHVESALGLSIVTEDDRTQVKALSNEVTKRAKGIFIWVKLVVKELVEGIIDGTSIPQLYQSLDSIPTELDALYTRIIQKRKPKHVLEMFIMSQILLCSQTPVSLLSLMAITDIALSDVVIETMSIYRMRQRLSSRCGGLLEIHEETHFERTGDERRTRRRRLRTEDEWRTRSRRMWTEDQRRTRSRRMRTEDEETKDDEMSGRSTIEFRYESLQGLIKDELANSHDRSDRVRNVQFLHQTVKFYLTSKGNIKSVFKDSGQCSLGNGWSYMLEFCVKAVTHMEFKQALAHRTTIADLFYYAWQLEQRTKTDHAELLDLLLVERKGWFQEGFERRLGKKARGFWKDCIHTMPHGRLKPDGLNLWCVCEYNEEMVSESVLGLRCLALPISSSLRAFDLLFLATFYGLSFYVKRKILEGAPLICPQKQRSLLWAASNWLARPPSDGSCSDSLGMLDLITSEGSCADLRYNGYTPLGNLLSKAYRFDTGKIIRLLMIMRKLLCSGADANTFIEGEAALFYLIRPAPYKPVGDAWGILELLLQHGANSRSVDPAGFEPLYLSVVSGNAVNTETLLRYGADPSNVGNNISAIEPSINIATEPSINIAIESSIDVSIRVLHKKMRKTFQRNAAHMHDLLVKYKDPLPTPPLCQCKLKQANNRPEPALAGHTGEGPRGP